MLTRITLPSREGRQSARRRLHAEDAEGPSHAERNATHTHAGGRAARGIDREAARKHKRRHTPKPLVFPCCLSIDVPDARRPAPTGGGMGASLCVSPRLSVLCVKRLSEDALPHIGVGTGGCSTGGAGSGGGSGESGGGLGCTGAPAAGGASGVTGAASRGGGSGNGIFSSGGRSGSGFSEARGTPPLPPVPTRESKPLSPWPRQISIGSVPGAKYSV